MEKNDLIYILQIRFLSKIQPLVLDFTVLVINESKSGHKIILGGGIQSLEDVGLLIQSLVLKGTCLKAEIICCMRII